MNAQMDIPVLFTQETDWEAVYRSLLPRIYNFFRYRLGDNALAEDLTAATFTKAWRARQQYSHDLGAFSTWLFAIARNVAADYFRQPHPEVPLDEAHHLADERPLEETIQRRSDFARLARLMNRLSTRERELIALKYGAEMTNRAI